MNRTILFYNVTALVGGMAIMAIEMTATRMLSPFFGTSIFVWTNVLGIIMAALAAGYFLGGRIADRFPVPRVFFTILVIASLVILLLPFAGPPLLKNVSQLLTTDTASLITASLLATVILFFPPFLLLGMISPYLIRLANRSVERTGHTAGSIFAISTAGSIIGTFLPTLLTVPLIGVRRTIIMFGAALCIIGAIGLGRKATYLLLVVFAACGIVASPFLISGPHIIAQTESPYSYIEIFRTPDNVEYLAFSEAFAVQSRYDENDVLNGGLYWDYFSLFLPLFSERPVKVAIIGNAGGTISRLLDYFYELDQALQIDGVELDPAVTQLAQQYFHLSIPSLTTHHQDGRIFLEQSGQQYQLIILDAYKELAVPPHLSSQEFFALVQKHLSPSGMLAININVSNTSSEVYQRLVATLQYQFTHTWDLAIPGAFNHLLIATDRDENLNELIGRATPPSRLQKYFDYAALELAEPKRLAASIITDDQPLTEIIFDTMILREMLRQTGR